MSLFQYNMSERKNMDEGQLRKLFELFQNSKGEEKFEPHAPLSKREAEEWDSIIKLSAKAHRMAEDAEAKRKLFWSKIERKTKIYDRNMRIDSGMILLQVNKKTNCKFHGEQMPGFCDGDCANCALNPDDLEN